jgi:hypothetical protein
VGESMDEGRGKPRLLRTHVITTSNPTPDPGRLSAG